MGREIKFRVWDKESNTMQEVGALDWDCDGKVITCNTSTTKLYQMEEDFVLMQYTGLNDKHGRKIYEGDILHSKKTGLKYDVVWLRDYGWWVKFDGDCEGDLSWCVNMCMGVVVIGNIYENPELLQEG